ncbi:hypothetical protein [Oceaniglobus roseus]|uniref:hypothetical protein n=1 Tax=Oceaniglobus roseus TaxID=1737570 RepID=UPI000C7E931A|nr:hypothetical protein [Kandeliimicrobium roseum]
MALLPGAALAHAAQSGFVLLLPTGIYIAAGCATVAATALIVALLPGGALSALFRPHCLFPLPDLGAARTVTSLASLALLGLLVVAGFLGPHDPLSNPLPLAIWTLWWIGLVSAQGVLGNLWAWVSPWNGAARLMAGGGARLPEGLGQWPAVVLFLLAMAFALADPAPDAPDRLATVVLGYALLTLAGVALFGAEWLARAECFTVLLRWFARLAPVQLEREARLGLPGWRALETPVPATSGAVFLLVLLGTGSFDGLNDTFWWLARIGINPLAFPGRSEIVGPTVAGLLAVNGCLVAAFWGCTTLGCLLVRRFAPESGRVSFGTAFRSLAVSILPIAFGYHVAHFLTTFLVNGQYALIALGDPLATGADLLGLGQFYVTTGFFNTRDTVRVIFLSQAGAIVLAHVLGVLMAHRISHDLFPGRRAALLGQIPLALFMVAYTLLGLWLLAAPRGV